MKIEYLKVGTKVTVKVDNRFKLSGKIAEHYGKYRVVLNRHYLLSKNGASVIVKEIWADRNAIEVDE